MKNITQIKLFQKIPIFKNRKTKEILPLMKIISEKKIISVKINCWSKRKKVEFKKFWSFLNIFDFKK